MFSSNNSGRMPEPTPGCDCDACKFIIAIRESEAESLLFAEALRSAQTAIQVAGLKAIAVDKKSSDHSKLEDTARSSEALVKTVTRVLSTAKSQIESAVDQFKAAHRDKEGE